MIITLQSTHTGILERFTLPELLLMLNCDRGPDWSAYNEGSTLREVTEAIDTLCPDYCRI